MIESICGPSEDDVKPRIGKRAITGVSVVNMGDKFRYTDDYEAIKKEDVAR